MYWLFWSFPSRSSTLEMVLATVLIEDMELVMRIVAKPRQWPTKLLVTSFQEVMILSSVVVVVLRGTRGLKYKRQERLRQACNFERRGQRECSCTH
jgi:hypothetical protein